jgi:hypothetical protein
MERIKLNTKNIKHVEVDKLQLPANPEDLIDLYDLKDRIILKKKLNTNIREYIRNYHNSFLKTEKQMTDTIPDHTINLHHVVWLNRLGQDSNKDDNFEWHCDCEFQYKTHYLPNYKEKIVYECIPIGKNQSFYYKQKKDILLVRTIFEKHSTFSRSYNPQLLYKYCQISIFDLRTNEALYSALYCLSASYSGYLEDSSEDDVIDEFVTARKRKEMYDFIKSASN